MLVWKELDYGKMQEKEKQHIVSEVNILRELKHPNIVRYYDRIIDKKNTKIFVFLTYFNIYYILVYKHNDFHFIMLRSYELNKN